MKITCGRRDDILKRKAEWEADYKAKKSRHDEQYNAFSSKTREVFSGLESEVTNELAKLNTGLDLQVTAGTHYGSTLSVKVTSNENNVHGADKALSWTWSAALTESGEVEKESSSWSGLQATTATQLQSLRDTLSVLEALNSMDWASILNRTLPNYSDYVTENDPSYGAKPNFDAELFASDVADLVGADVLVEGERGSGKYYRGTVYYHIVSETPATFTVAELYGDSVETLQYYNKKYDSLADLVAASSGDTYRVKKDAFMNKLVQPLSTLEY